MTVGYRQTSNDKRGIRKPWVKLFTFAFLILTVGLFIHKVTVRADPSLPEIWSGVSGYCLDIHDNITKPNAMIDSWTCNHTEAQAWTASIDSLRHNGTYCLSTYANGVVIGTPVVLNACDDSPGQVWLQGQHEFMNPHSGLCLSLPDSKTGHQLILANCIVSAPDEAWFASTKTGACKGTEGQMVACLAEQAWATWQSGNPSHESLLNLYTDGAAYEQWCADFISYIYKEAGHPFTQGEADGWDENQADNIQYMGFTKHDPHSYSPKPGDVAYFDYPGGHVEIVVKSGPTPTFIYGDSATVDPTTGNGQMAANTLINNGSLGKLTYYLSPNN